MSCRKIIHIDMDAFFASVEQRDFPEYKGKPLVVGGGSERGVVAAASYEARKFGVRSAMSGMRARQLCDQLIFVKPRFDVYKRVSLQIQQIFYEYTYLVEPLSLDEAFLDVSVPLKGPCSATLIANEIRSRIRNELNLTASAGISYNKFLAKMASDIHKPDGYYLIKPQDADSFLETLPIEKFFGVGKVTAAKFKKLGIYDGGTLKNAKLEALLRNFGKSGLFFYNIARGIDNRPVEVDRERKSIGAENTFNTDLCADQDLHAALKEITEILQNRILKAKMYGRTLTLKIKYNDFSIINRSKSFSSVIKSRELIFATAVDLLNEHRDVNKPIRLLGITISQLEYAYNVAGKQLELEF